MVDFDGFGLGKDAEDAAEDAAEEEEGAEVGSVCLFSRRSFAKASSSIRRASSLPTTPFCWGTSSLNPLPLDIWAILSTGGGHECVSV